MAREGGAEAVAAPALAGSPAAASLGALGFRPREKGTEVITFAPEGSVIRPLLDDPLQWWMVEGDRDV
jgi:hypothetical protein